MKVYKGLAGGTISKDAQECVVLIDAMAGIYLKVYMKSGAVSRLNEKSVNLLKTGLTDKPTKSISWLISKLGEKSSARLLTGLHEKYYEEREAVSLPPFFFSSRIEWLE